MDSTPHSSGGKAPEDMTNDEIREELSAIAIELAEVDTDAWPGDLYERRQALRQEVTSRPPNRAEIETLEREAVGIHSRLTQIQRNRPDVAAAGDGGQSGGSGIAEAQAVAFEYDERSGSRALIERLAFIQARIERARSAE